LSGCWHASSWVRSAIHSLVPCISCVGVFLLVSCYFICSGSRSTLLCVHDCYAMAMGSDPLSHTQIPCSPCIRYCVSITHPRRVCYRYFFLLCKFFYSEEHGSLMLLTAVIRDPLLLWKQGTLDIGRNGFQEHRVVCPLTLGLNAHSNDALQNLFDTGRSSIACRLLYGPATRLSNLGMRGCIECCAFFLIRGYFSMPPPVLPPCVCFYKRP
jgi:hypothetical protein